MKNPRHQFVLLGFLAQALTWDNGIALAAVTTLWIFCLTVLRGRIRISLRAEAVVLFLGCVGSFFLSKVAGASAHFFLGDGLILLQAVRLVRPLNGREKLTSILIACFHFAVLCTLAQNFRFALLFAAAVFVLPKAVEDLQRERFTDEEQTQLSDETIDRPETARPRVQELTSPENASDIGAIFHDWTFLRPGTRALRWLPRYLTLLGSSALIFLALPRFFAGAPLFHGFGDQDSLLDTVLDPRRAGAANSERVLMQIEGQNIGYLKCYALTEFDGVRWGADQNAALQKIHSATKSTLKPANHRLVRVKRASVLGRMLPIDGSINYLQGNFFERALQNIHGTIECGSMWNTANNVYDYWIDPHPEPEILPAPLQRRLTWHPRQSQRLKAWLTNATSGATNQLQIARKLERYLSNKYSYEVGTPQLDRLNPVEDFIFNRRSGHCERFAAALGLFFRMEGIPSRVIIGYVPTTRNPFSGWQQVRMKDAHSWTEGYIDDLGWLKFDATPGPPGGFSDWNISHLIETLDFAWYSYVVNFDGFAQKQLYTQTARTITDLPALAKKYWFIPASLFAIALLVGAVRKRFWKSLRWSPKRKPASQIVARHFYGRMLRELEKSGHVRAPDQTPYEFLERLRAASIPALPEAETLTTAFCDTTYGRRLLAPESERNLEAALKRLATSLKRGSPTQGFLSHS